MASRAAQDLSRVDQGRLLLRTSRARSRVFHGVVSRAGDGVWATESEIRRTMRSLEALAQKEASVKAKPTNAVRRRSQKLKDIAHQALCLGNVLERLGRERGDLGAREADAAVPRAVGGAAAVQEGGVGCRRGGANRRGEGGTTRERVMDIDIEPTLASSYSQQVALHCSQAASYRQHFRRARTGRRPRRTMRLASSRSRRARRSSPWFRPRCTRGAAIPTATRGPA